VPRISSGGPIYISHVSISGTALATDCHSKWRPLSSYPLYPLRSALNSLLPRLICIRVALFTSHTYHSAQLTHYDSLISKLHSLPLSPANFNLLPTVAAWHLSTPVSYSYFCFCFCFCFTNNALQSRHSGFMTVTCVGASISGTRTRIFRRHVNM
jgi:hypothetical protein